ncbi:MAG: cache domain-containing protein [Candidatus Competibacteraceae bacterium]
MLVAVAVAISVRNYVNLTNQFDRQRQSAYEQHVKEMEALLQQSLGRLRQLGGLISALPGVPKSLADGDINRLQQALEPQWPALQLDLGIDTLGFYDTQARSLASWSTNPWGEDRQSAQVGRWISQVNASETPVVKLLCDPNCGQYAVLPVLTNGRHVGAVLVGSSVADLVLTASRISGKDIGLLVRNDLPVTGISSERRIQPWNTTTALTYAEQNLNLLRNAAVSTTLLNAADGVRAIHSAIVSDIHVVSPCENLSMMKRCWIVITDITATLEEIRSTTEGIFGRRIRVVVASGRIIVAHPPDAHGTLTFNRQQFAVVSAAPFKPHARLLVNDPDGIFSMTNWISWKAPLLLWPIVWNSWKKMSPNITRYYQAYGRTGAGT